jgi:hypothetical protein
MARARTRHLTLERLEKRCLLTAFGVPWPEIGHLTLSFAPDGTPAGGHASNLFATLNAQMPARQWEEDVVRAFQTWAVQSNINIGLVADGGQPFGVLGLKQSDPRFGDVRIGAFPMGTEVLAVANPYDPFVANTWVGDVFLNSAFAFGGNGANSNYDLFSVALHEAGHVLGIGHSSDPNSPMFERFHAGANLTRADAASLQALYGIRQADVWEGPAGNGSLATAAPLEFNSSADGAASIDVAADIRSLSDVDSYRLAAPQGSQSLEVSVDVAGYSLLTPRVIVLDATGKVVSAAVATDPLNNNLSIALDHVEPGGAYVVQVSSGRGDVFGIGSYELHATFHGPKLVVPHNTNAAGPNAAQNGAQQLAAMSGYVQHDYRELNGMRILATTPGYVEHTYYELDDTVNPATATRTYEVRSADVGPDLTNVMTVVLNYSDYPGVKFKVVVHNDQGNLVATKTMADFAGHLELQAMSVYSARNYYIKVISYRTPADGATYELRVDYAQDGTHLENYVNDSLSRDQHSLARTLQVNESQQFHLVLGTSDWSAPTQAGLRMQIVDQHGQSVYAMSVADGALRSGDVFLDSGRYIVTFTRAAESDDAPVIFQLGGLTTSEPLGPQLQDTTQEPLDSPTASALAQLAFYWLPNNSNVAAAILVNHGSPVQGAPDPVAAPSAAAFSRNPVTDAKISTGVVQVAQPIRDDRATAVIFARPGYSDDMSAAQVPIDAGAVLRQIAAANARLFAAPSFSGRSTSQERLVSCKQRPILNLREMTAIQPHNAAHAAGSAPVLVDEVLSAESDNQPSDGEDSPSAAAPLAENRSLIDRFFAWIQSLDARADATWTLPPVCAALGWIALKRLPRVRREDRLVEARLPGRDRLAPRRCQTIFMETIGAPRS